jgi:hypothetical protein
MSKLSSVSKDEKTSMAFLLASKPTVPMNAKQPRSEKRVLDPSANNPKGRSYPVPSFFEYRFKPKEYDSL